MISTPQRVEICQRKIANEVETLMKANEIRVTASEADQWPNYCTCKGPMYSFRLFLLFFLFDQPFSVFCGLSSNVAQLYFGL